jgi:hypothetical protein
MHRAFVVDDANRRLVNRYVQSAEEFHRRAPALFNRRDDSSGFLWRGFRRGARTRASLQWQLAPITAGPSNRAVLVTTVLVSIYTPPLRSRPSGARRSHAAASVRSVAVHEFLRARHEAGACWPMTSRRAPSISRFPVHRPGKITAFHSGPRHHHRRLSAAADSQKTVVPFVVDVSDLPQFLRRHSDRRRVSVV